VKPVCPIISPRAFDLATVLQKLKQLVKPIDARPCVLELWNMAYVPLTAFSLGVPERAFGILGLPLPDDSATQFFNVV
jgi:hypothetical protein